MQVLDEHTRSEDFANLLAPLLAGNDTGLLSEAGCPAIADPGAELVRIAHQKNIRGGATGWTIVHPAGIDGIWIEWPALHVPRLPTGGT